MTLMKKTIVPSGYPFQPEDPAALYPVPGMPAGDSAEMAHQFSVAAAHDISSGHDMSIGRDAHRLLQIVP